MRSDVGHECLGFPAPCQDRIRCLECLRTRRSVFCMWERIFVTKRAEGGHFL